MSKIRVLPDALANKIAAGEVVERPASVVKELLENALDAGARKINIEIESGGKRLIRIIDDGEGMTRDDAIVAFERHATSKLRTAEDLESISTLGFRGEALPSIAAVSKLLLRTKTTNDIEGTEVEFHGGKLLAVRDVAHPGGTEIEVKDLFFNMPARRKFLKSDTTESYHITNLVQHYALAKPEISFLLVNNGRDSIRVAATQSLKDRAYQILGRTMLDKLLEVNYEADGLKIGGFVSNPQEQRSSRDSQFLFVNHRFVRDQLINRALTEAYRSMMPSGTYPAAVLFIEVPPTEVDVNVHPAKTEVRFLHEAAILAFVRDGVAQALRSTEPVTQFPRVYPDRQSVEERVRIDAPRWQNPVPSWQQRTLTNSESIASISSVPSETIKPSSVVEQPNYNSVAPTSSAPALPLNESQNGDAITLSEQNTEIALEPAEIDSNAISQSLSVEKLNNEGQVPVSQAEKVSFPSTEIQINEPMGALDGVKSLSFEESTNAKAEIPIASDLGHGITPLGQIRDSYIVATDDEGLLLIDQHVAHERVLFEQIRDGKLSQIAEVQPLLLPETMDLSPAEAEAFKVVREELEHMGIEAMELSGRTIAIKSAPTGIASKDVVSLIQQLLSAVERERRSFTVETVRDEIAASLACKAAIKINMPLTNEKMQWLIDRLMETQNPMTCPHGRPIIMRFGLRDIERGFKRPV
jgi:DNA mismatch repair protein MutL